MNRHLTQLARKGGNPMDFKFVEHHKVCLVQQTLFQHELNNKRSLNYFDGGVCLVLVLYVVFATRSKDTISLRAS